MSVNNVPVQWENVVTLEGGSPVRRLAVPGGWLYQVCESVQIGDDTKPKWINWHPPILVKP